MLVPRRTHLVHRFGQATMYIYLLHSFVLYPIRETGVLGGEHSSLAVVAAGIVVVCIGVSIALAIPFVRRVFRPLIEPKPDWLFIELEDDVTGPSRVDPTGSRRGPRLTR